MDNPARVHLNRFNTKTFIVRETGVRPELDLEAAMWTIPAQRIKRKRDGKENGEPHLVPLPVQAVSIFESVKAVTGGGRWCSVVNVTTPSQ